MVIESRKALVRWVLVAAPWKHRAPEGESITFVRAMAANHNPRNRAQRGHIDRAASERLQLAQVPCNGFRSIRRYWIGANENPRRSRSGASGTMAGEWLRRWSPSRAVARARDPSAHGQAATPPQKNRPRTGPQAISTALNNRDLFFKVAWLGQIVGRAGAEDKGRAYQRGRFARRHYLLHPPLDQAARMW